MKKIKICGISYNIKEVNVIDEADEGIVQGKIVYSQGKILIKKSLPKRIKKPVIYHEVVHGILMELGYSELATDENLVQGLSNEIYRMFKLKKRSYK